MRVLQVIPSITNYFTFLDELTAAAMDSGLEMALAASPTHFRNVSCYETKPRCQYFPLDLPQGMNPLAHFRAAAALRRVVDEWRPDLIHVHIGAAIFAVSLARKSGWPKVMATHHGLLGPSMPGIRGKLGAAAEAWTFGRVDQAYLLNRSDLDWMRSSGRRVDHVRVYSSMGIGCRTDVFDPQLRTATETVCLRASLGLNADQTVFIFVGRQVWFKGFDLVAKAFMRYHQDYPQSRLLLLGEPYTVHPTGLSESEQSAFDQCPGVIRMGWVNNVQSYLALADLNLFPSEREGMPVNLMESLCMGVPVITRDTRGCNEVVTNGETGLLLPERSVDALLAAMNRLCSDKKLLEDMRRRAIEKRATMDRGLWIREQIQSYRNIIHSTASRS